MMRIGRTCAIYALAVLAPTAGYAATPGVEVSGGVLDPAVADADVYVETPKEAKVPNSAACRMGKRYLDYIRTGQVARMADLFEDDAVHIGALGTYLRGREQLNNFFVNVIGPLATQTIPVAYTANGRDCMIAVAVDRKIQGQARWMLAVVDHFTLGKSGKIAREVAFARRLPKDVTDRK